MSKKLYNYVNKYGEHVSLELDTDKDEDAIKFISIPTNSFDTVRNATELTPKQVYNNMIGKVVNP